MRENSAQIGVIEPIVIAEVEVRSPVIPVEIGIFVVIILSILVCKVEVKSLLGRVALIAADADLVV
jgi:hypothetical protein